MQNILKKHVIDNSCGDGAFLIEIVRRYCSEFLSQRNDLSILKTDLETYIHGIELDVEEYQSCVKNLNEVAENFDVSGVSWDILNADTLTVDKFNGKMDYVFGNPPYVRVHNLETSYETVKKFRFAEKGMTDLFIVFFEIGFKMLSENGLMCLITPSSWLSSNAGKNIRNYITLQKNLSGVIDLEHFQPFAATTYTLISRFEKTHSFNELEYYTFDENILRPKFEGLLSLKDINICNSFYLALNENIEDLKKIKTAHSYKYVSVKNGFATLADKVFIGDFDFQEGTIDILKASTGKWSKCIFPYNNQGIPLSIKEMKKNKQAFAYLCENRNKLAKSRDTEDENLWYLFGRTQALKDVFRNKIAINTVIKDTKSIKLQKVDVGKGIYSGLYILTEISFVEISELIYSEDFINYVKKLKNYKSGGYYTFASKDLEQYLNYKLTEIYGQSRISSGCRELF